MSYFILKMVKSSVLDTKTLLRDTQNLTRLKKLGWASKFQIVGVIHDYKFIPNYVHSFETSLV